MLERAATKNATQTIKTLRILPTMFSMNMIRNTNIASVMRNMVKIAIILLTIADLTAMSAKVFIKQKDYEQKLK